MNWRRLMHDEEEFVVFISHGRSSLWKDLERYINKDLNFATLVLKEEVNRGRTIIEKLEDETEDCHFAIIIMTADDEQKDGGLRARQNVIHEIGFCQGRFGRNNVLVLKQNGVEEFTNISGIVYESFSEDNIAITFSRVAKELEDAFEEFNEEE
ncbi:nucleotide-binding protein [Leptospira sarikeiensis]|uniref:Nucleotide-binding protein n=2 Tax=Leptospira sarikeiensis TaxID=2484943 RepID=A0A4R9KDB7_9LEPT|nr:nucleotide-binding protein [Leptospira sarikeiensis]